MAEQELPDFTSWLMKMLPNETYIGALARYVQNDPMWPRAVNDRLAFLGYLLRKQVDRSLIKAFAHAWGLYQLARKRATQGD